MSLGGSRLTRGWWDGAGHSLGSQFCALSVPGGGPELGWDRRRHWGWAPFGPAQPPWCPVCPRGCAVGLRPRRPQELLAEWQLGRGHRSACGRLRRAAVLALVWLLCLGSTLGCTVAVYTFSEHMIEVRVGGQPQGQTEGSP